MMCSLIATISPWRRSISAHRRAFRSAAVRIAPPPAPSGPRPARSDGTPGPSGPTSVVAPTAPGAGRGRTRLGVHSASSPRGARGEPMPKGRFPVLVATDGSAPARAAVDRAIVFPWPAGSAGHGLVARGIPVLTDATPAVWDALLEAARAEARRAERRLRRRWPDAKVVV